MEELRLFSYKMANDTGFAPNPFHGFLTLANCKPQIRKSKKVGDWIAGFTSKALNRDMVGDERLIYLMKVTSKIDYLEYWNNPFYSKKIPISSGRDLENIAGDNIYTPIGSNRFEQIKNWNHKPKDIERDLSGANILISDTFYYFGISAIYVPHEIRPSVPKGQSSQGVRTYDTERILNFLNYMTKNFNHGIIDYPHKWPRN